MSQWLEKKIEGNSIEKYLVDRKYQVISIYGCGSIGKMFYEDMIQNSSIKVQSFIEKESKEIEWNTGRLEVYSIKQVDYSGIDAIIVTPFYAFEQIKSDLNNLGCNVPIISIEELVAE